MKKAICMMLAVTSQVMGAPANSQKLVWKQDLTKEELRSIDKDNLDSPWNDQFKVPAHTFKHKKVRKALKQSAEEVEEVEEAETPTGKCPISLATDTRTNLYMLTYGYMQGLYASEFYPSRDGCDRCELAALPFSQMVYALANVLSLFEELITDAGFADQTAAEQLTFLYQSYLVFWDFGSNFDLLLNEGSAKIQYR